MTAAAPTELVLTTGPAANGGSCVARHDGRVVFVRYALPGEQVRVRVTSEKGSYWHAEAIEVLEAEVNPSIASHGGRADLVALDEVEGIAYLKLSGGCQGCAMSRMTLSQGIEVSLKDAIPQLTAVVDVTDHAQGGNPFYEG